MTLVLTIIGGLLGWYILRWFGKAREGTCHIPALLHDLSMRVCAWPKVSYAQVMGDIVREKPDNPEIAKAFLHRTRVLGGYNLHQGYMTTTGLVIVSQTGGYCGKMWGKCQLDEELVRLFSDKDTVVIE